MLSRFGVIMIDAPSLRRRTSRLCGTHSRGIRTATLLPYTWGHQRSTRPTAQAIPLRRDEPSGRRRRSRTELDSGKQAATATSHADPDYVLSDAKTLLDSAPSREAVVQVGQGPFAARELPDGRLVLVSSKRPLHSPGPDHRHAD